MSTNRSYDERSSVGAPPPHTPTATATMYQGDYNKCETKNCMKNSNLLCICGLWLTCLLTTKQVANSFYLGYCKSTPNNFTLDRVAPLEYAMYRPICSFFITVWKSRTKPIYYPFSCDITHDKLRMFQDFPAFLYCK